MRTVWLASLRTHTRRYLAAAVAVVIGVAFIVVTAALASSTRAGMSAGIDAPYRSADAVVAEPDVDTAAALVQRRNASPVGWAIEPVRTGERTLSDRADVGIVATDPAWRWQELTAGRFPSGPGEAVVDSATAKSEDVGIGDRLRIGTGEQGVAVAVVGIVDAPTALARASLYVTWPQLLTWHDSIRLTAVGIAGDASGVADAEPVADYVDDTRAELDHQVDLVAIVLLLFGSIALFVSVLVIANTFSILFAQRMRDFALLRCIGATRRQIARSVRLEALAVGVLASLAGLLLGAGLGHAIVAIVRARFASAALGAVTIGWDWLVGGFLVGLVATLVASWLPTRKVLRVSPLAALRPQEEVDVRSRAGLARIALGVALVVAGIGLLAVAVTARETAAMIAGGGASFAGVLLLGPVLVPAAVGVVGAGLGRVLGPEVRLASANAVRNPRRTAATAASLLVGVTLTTAVLTGMATARGAMSGEMDLDNPVDVALTSATPLPDDVATRAAAVPDVAAAVPVEGARLRIDDRDVTVLAAPGADVLRSREGLPTAAEIVLPSRIADGLPDTVTVGSGGTTARLRVRVADGFGGALVAPRTLARLAGPTGTTATYAVWVRAAGGADPEDLGGSIGALAPDADLENGLSNRAWVDLQLDVVTGAVVGLLAISVTIALVGIANTLGLSVLERGREHALLRALGLTRRQLRRALAAEAVLLSVVATVLGTVIGVAFAWVAVQTLVEKAVADASMVLPVGQLALVVLIAAGAGLLSCLLPARRAAKVSPAAGLAIE